MPRMDGLELIVRLRMERPEILIVLVSGFVDTLGLNEAITGADAVIQKSANEVTHLVRAVNRLLRRKPSKKPAGVSGGAASEGQAPRGLNELPWSYPARKGSGIQRSEAAVISMPTHRITKADATGANLKSGCCPPFADSGSQFLA